MDEIDSEISVGINEEGTKRLRRAGEIAEREFELAILQGASVSYALGEVVCALANSTLLLDSSSKYYREDIDMGPLASPEQ